MDLDEEGAVEPLRQAEAEGLKAAFRGVGRVGARAGPAVDRGQDRRAHAALGEHGGEDLAGVEVRGGVGRFEDQDALGLGVVLARGGAGTQAEEELSAPCRLRIAERELPGADEEGIAEALGALCRPRGDRPQRSGAGEVPDQQGDLGAGLRVQWGHRRSGLLRLRRCFRCGQAEQQEEAGGPHSRSPSGPCTHQLRREGRAASSRQVESART